MRPCSRPSERDAAGSSLQRLMSKLKAEAAFGWSWPLPKGGDRRYRERRTRRSAARCALRAFFSRTPVGASASCARSGSVRRARSTSGRLFRRSPSPILPRACSSSIPPSIARSQRSLRPTSAARWPASKARVEPGGRDQRPAPRARDRPCQLGLVVLTHMHSTTPPASPSTPRRRSSSPSAREHATTDDRPPSHGYNPAHFDYLFDYRTIDFDGALSPHANSFGRTRPLRRRAASASPTRPGTPQATAR